MRGENSTLDGFPAGTFYGTKQIKEKKGDTIDRDITAIQQEIIDTPIPRRLTGLFGPSLVWKVFSKQQDALNFAKNSKSGLMTFAFEKRIEQTGQRLFLVAHPSFFWFYHAGRKPEERCSYEVIPEGTVCKLYLDLEYDRHLNPNKFAVKLVEIFTKIVVFFLHKYFKITCTREHILDLDSSNDKKFSRHLIFNLPNAAFRNNYCVGNFVRNVCNHLRYSVINGESTNSTKKSNVEEMCSYCSVTDQDICDLFVVDSKGKQTLFCDEGVYTKNRNFRLYLSTKYKKNTPLILSKENQYKHQKRDKGLDVTDDEAMFLDSLVTYVENKDGMKILEFGEENEICKATRSRAEGTGSASSSRSMYPVVDNFITELVAPGFIRRWWYFSQSSRIVYDINGHRYCSNIQREHRSNNVMYVVDLISGAYYQKCHDPECVNFRSSELKLPPEVLFSLDINSVEDNEFETSVRIENYSDLLDNCEISDTDLAEVEYTDNACNTLFSSEISDRELVEIEACATCETNLSGIFEDSGMPLRSSSQNEDCGLFDSCEISDCELAEVSDEIEQFLECEKCDLEFQTNESF